MERNLSAERVLGQFVGILAVSAALVRLATHPHINELRSKQWPILGPRIIRPEKLPHRVRFTEPVSLISASGSVLPFHDSRV